MKGGLKWSLLFFIFRQRLTRRRMAQEHNVDRQIAGCPGEICATLGLYDPSCLMRRAWGLMIGGPNVKKLFISHRWSDLCGLVSRCGCMWCTRSSWQDYHRSQGKWTLMKKKKKKKDCLLEILNISSGDKDTDLWMIGDWFCCHLDQSHDQGSKG